MASFHAGRSMPVPGTDVSTASSAMPEELLAPVMAGAFARGVAEMLDLLGLPGVFLDRSGGVLFASQAAGQLLKGPLRLHMRHIVAEQADDNRALAAFVAVAVGSGEPGAVRLIEAEIELRCLPRSKGFAMPDQMVRAVILMADDADPRHAAMLSLLA